MGGHTVVPTQGGRIVKSGQEEDLTSYRERDLVGLINEVRHERISRKQFVYRALGLGLSASAVGGLLAACGKKNEEQVTKQTNTIGPTTKPDNLNLYNWSDYMPASVKKGFEKRTGIRVVETFFDDNEALLSKLKAGATGYDVIVPSDYMLHIMLMTGILEPLVMENIPNFKYVDVQFVKPEYDNPESPENKGLKYSVPYQWGTTGYAVRIDKVDPASVGRWADLFMPDGAKYKGQIQMLNDERDCLGAALRVVGVRDTGRPYSGNTTDPSQVDAAKEALIEQKPLVRAYDSVNQKRAMVTGNPITMCWNGDTLMAIDALGGDAQAKSLLKFLLPKEAFFYWSDTMAVPKGYHSKYAAHLFFDYILDPEVMGQVSSWTWYLPVEMEAAKPYTDPFVFLTRPTAEDLKRGEIGLDLGAFGRYYTDAWAEVKSA